MGPGPASSSRSALLREPTLHFVVLAAALFGLRAAFRPNERYVIRVDPSAVEARAARVERESGTPLTAEQRAVVERAVVDEEILVREARALGLDDDPRVDDILVQKMLHVLSGEVIQPSDAELAAYYERHAERYVGAGRITFDELVFETDRPLPSALREQLESGASATDLRTGIPIRTNAAVDVRATDLVAAFGPETSAKIEAAAIGAWIGPHRTVRGEHWFRVRERGGGEPLSLQEARTRVREDWIRDQEETLLKRRVEELRGRYRVVSDPGCGRR
jgi:hypothetical protein